MNTPLPRGKHWRELWGDGATRRPSGYPRGISAVPNEVFATAFFAHSTEIVAKMAGVLGRKDDAVEYGKLFEEIKAAFNKDYVAADARIRGDTQASYALALHFNLLDESLRPKAVEHLLEAIKKYQGHPSTGIQTTHRMMLELTRNGRHDEACRLISLRTAPSWGFMVEMVATTIWEHWDGYVKGRGFQNPGVNSFNHWALGSVGEWIWRNIAGINPDEAHPGYQHFFIRPQPGDGVTWAKGQYDSIRGRISSDWKIAEGSITLKVAVPPNTTATVYVPTQDAAAVKESGQPASQADGVTYLRGEAGAAVYQLGSVSETYGEQEGTAYNGHFGCTCYHPLFCFKQFGDVEESLLRNGNEHSAKDWRAVLEPVVARYQGRNLRCFFRADAAFAQPELYEYLEAEGFEYAIRLPANDALLRDIEPLLTRPVGRPSNAPVVWYASFLYQAKSWDRARRVVAKVEWHNGELFPRVGFIVTNLTRPAKRVVRFYNQRGTAEQWIKEGKNAVKWTRLSCHDFVDNQVRLQLFVLAYNLGNFLRQAVLPQAVRHWTLTTLREKLIKIGAKVVRHSGKIVFQMAEVAVPRELFRAILERIGRLRLATVLSG